MLAAADIAVSRTGGTTRQGAGIILSSFFHCIFNQVLWLLTDKMPAVKTKGIHAPLEISPALAKIIGTEKGEKLTRGQVVKKLYAYIKEEGLQDAEYKMYFRPDKTMKPVFGEDTLRMCHMMKHLKEHLTSAKK